MGTTKTCSLPKNVLTFLVERIFWGSMCRKYKNTHTCTHCLSIVQCYSVPHCGCDSDMTVVFCVSFRFLCSDSREWRVLPGIMEKDPIQITLYPWQPLVNTGFFLQQHLEELLFLCGLHLHCTWKFQRIYSHQAGNVRGMVKELIHLSINHLQTLIS